MTVYMVVAFIITYLICSVNPAIEICKLKTGEDIRKLGSGNAGTANAMRVLGKPLGQYGHRYLHQRFFRLRNIPFPKHD